MNKNETRNKRLLKSTSTPILEEHYVIIEDHRLPIFLKKQNVEKVIFVL